MSSLARAISIIGHPMALVPLSIALAMRGRVTRSEATLILAAVFASIAVVAVYVVHGVRTGRLSHIDVSRREERKTFYRVAMASTAAATLWLHYSGAPRGAVFGVATAFALLFVGSIVNRWIKASLHTAFAIVAAGIVGTGAPMVFALFVSMAAAVAWSRIALGRHSRREVAVGAAMGGAAAITLVWARGFV